MESDQRRGGRRGGAKNENEETGEASPERTGSELAVELGAALRWVGCEKGRNLNSRSSELKVSGTDFR